MNIRHYLAKFEKKKTPDRITLNYETAIHYDAYSVYITHLDSGQEYLFKGYENNKISVLRWNSEQNIFNIPENLNPDGLVSESFSGIYYYKAHELRFTTLKDLTWWREMKFKLSAIKDNWVSSREKYRYRKQRKEIKNLHDVLSAVISLYLDQKEGGGISHINIMSVVFGKLWFYHDEKDRMRKQLTLTLEAFVINGELTKTHGGNYTVNGRALMTLNKYIEEEQRYVESTKIQKRMVWATVFSFIAAFASAVAAFKALK
ncbi:MULTISPECIES: hypothetical protein [Rahnella]|uniref:Uncharacterized protein n=1 Tax=Rahnella woolbedingensis TaxID=1510574 RepID=A0A419N414_9GAMM|nr:MULTISPECIES: hypothetical protein [Rahnella]RJT39124.1 hypothetical protein D6C13_20715 [Rahnella woolbedingensis]TBX32162.1 hypothetical protein EYY67_19295 [Rahnella victoriana]